LQLLQVIAFPLRLFSFALFQQQLLHRCLSQWSDITYQAQGQHHLITWQHSAGQVCQDLAWEKLHTGDWKNVPVVRPTFIADSSDMLLSGNCSYNITCTYLCSY